MYRKICFACLVCCFAFSLVSAQEGWVSAQLEIAADLYSARVTDFGPLVVGQNGLCLVGPDYYDGGEWSFVNLGTDADLYAIVGEYGVAPSFILGDESTYLLYQDDDWILPLFVDGEYTFTTACSNMGMIIAAGHDQDDNPVLGISHQQDSLLVSAINTDYEGLVPTGLRKDFLFTIYMTIIYEDTLGALLKSEDDGETWQTVFETEYRLNSIGGQTFGIVDVIAGDDGMLWITEDDGQTWDDIHTPTTQNLNDAVFSDSWTFNTEVIHAVGDSGVVLFSRDYGESWTVQDCPANSRLTSVSTADGHGIISGEGGLILTTDNEGFPANELPPGDFILATPTNGSTVARDHVPFSWGPSTDPEGMPVWYYIEVSFDGSPIYGWARTNETNLILDFYEFDEIPRDGGEITWRVKSSDGLYETEASNAPFHFFLPPDTSAPQPFALLTPLDSAIVDRNNVWLDWEDATDNDNSPIRYAVEMTFLDGQVVVRDTVASSQYSIDLAYVDGLPHDTLGGKWNVTALDPYQGTLSSNGPQDFVIDHWELGNSDPVEHITPTEWKITSTWPNPFNQTVRIAYTLPKAAKVTLEVYDILGQRVQTLFNDTQHSGEHLAVWNGCNASGQPLASGTYLVRFAANGGLQQTTCMTRKVMLVR